MSVETVVVGIGDLSVSGETLGEAVVRARSAHVQLHLVHAYRDLAQAWLSDDALAAVEPLRQAREARLAETAAAMEVALGIEAGRVEYHARPGTPAAVLVSVAREQRAHLIAIGASRRSGVNWGAGGIVRRLARSAPCPVLVVPTLPAPGLRRFEARASARRAQRGCVLNAGGARPPTGPRSAGTGRRHVLSAPAPATPGTLPARPSGPGADEPSNSG